tara:strand:- start:20896 stop:21660 length:765 start_codon:yes stop_codon:yes gene_type:complete
MKAYRKKKKYLQTESIVLKVFDFGEADRIFTLLTPDNGIIRAVAKGVRKPKSRMGGHIDVLSKVNIYISLGENLSNISQAEIINNYSILKKDLSLISISFYILELCEKFSVENDPNNDIYYHLSYTLDILQENLQNPLLIRWFEINLLTVSGFLPELYNCLISGEELDEGDHLFSSVNGGLVDKKYATSTDSYIPIDKNSIKALRYLSNNGWPEVNKINFGSNSLDKLKIILRKYIQTITNSQINSEKFLSRIF